MITKRGFFASYYMDITSSAQDHDAIEQAHRSITRSHVFPICRIFQTPLIFSKIALV